MPAKPKTEQDDYRADVSGLEDAWEEGLEQAPGGVLSDGDYQAKITISRVELAPWNEWQWSLRFEDVNGGGGVWLNCGLSGDERVKFTASVAKRLGYGGSLADLKDACEMGTFDDLICGITVKTKPGETRDFTNVYINSVLGKSSEAEAAAKDEDIPF